MKVKNAVILSEEEENALFNIPVKCLMQAYSSMEEQNAALASAKADFISLLNRYVQLSFKYGKKIGKAKADEKDTSMYQPKM